MYSVNGGTVKDLDTNPGQRELDISPGAVRDTEKPIPDQWEFVQLFGTLEVREDVIDQVFPPEERDDPPGHLYIAVQCHTTIYRDRVDVKASIEGEGSYDVSIKLPFDRFRGRIRLLPYLARSGQSDRDTSYATQPHAKLADGEGYEIVIDRSEEEEPPGIDGEEASFSEAEHLPDGHRIYYLDFRDQERPKLWINSDYPRIAEILRSDGSIGARARMRDVILDQITYGVWNQLILRAGTAIDRNGNVPYEWQENVLRAFARRLYDQGDMEEAKLRLRSDLRDRDSLHQLIDRIDGELQEFVEPRKQYLNLIEEGLKI